MKSKIYDILITLVFSLAAVSCTEDPLYDPSYIGEGEAEVTAEVTFKAFTPSKSSRAVEGGASGSLMKHIDNLCVVFYVIDDNQDKLAYTLFYDKLDTEDSTDAPSDITYGESGHRAETTTLKTTIRIPKINYGKYHVYAVANVDRSLLTEDVLSDSKNLKNLQLQWNENPTELASNSQMFGYFTLSSADASKGFDAPEIIINQKNVTLHSWIKRAASKVTVAFDGTNLNPGVEIFIKSVQIFDIPKTCLLGADNPATPSEENSAPDPLNDYSKIELINDPGQIMTYYPDGVDAGNVTPASYTSSWPGYVSKTHPINGYNQAIANSDESSEQKLIALHGEDINAFYFYENLQGLGKEGTPTDKYQQVTDEHKNQGIVSYPGGVDPDDVAWKDAKPYGTYIIVQAYYKSNDPTGKEGEGKITYRFMLGKDTHLDYNAERNHHYKLTLRFNHWANDVDWHIDYKKDDEPKLRFPRPFYISYLYNHTSMIPLEFDADKKDVQITSVTVNITENNWAPTDCEYGWNGTLQSTTDYNKIVASQPNSSLYNTYYRYVSTPDIVNAHPWNGFLSLYRPQYSLVIPEPENLTHTQPSIFNQSYYNSEFGTGLHTRTYSGDDVKISEYPLYEAMDKDKIHVSWDNGTYYVKIPIWTRARNLITRTGYTGNNIYNAYYRDAKVNVKIKLSNGEELDSSKGEFTGIIGSEGNVDVRQVRRLVNPKGIYRSKDNTNDFHVVLKVLEDDASTNFVDLESDGPWRAYIIRESEEFITLEGAPGTTTSEHIFMFNDEVMTRPSIEGIDKSKIDFTIKFKNAATTPRYAIIRVEYNYNSCYHLIFVRQGMEADDTFGDGRKWCTGNNIDQNTIATNPLDEGSLFKFGNWNGIKSESNVNKGKTSWRLVTPNDFKDNGGKNLKMTDGSTMDWDNITYNNPASSQFIPGGNYRVATLEDYKSLMPPSTNDDGSWPIRVGYGVCYFDGATETAGTIDKAFGHKGSQEDKEGMRGCFVYDTRTGGNIFFPIGSSGYGHRKNDGWNWNHTQTTWPEGVSGLLRYSCNARWGYFDAVSASNTEEKKAMYKYGIFDSPMFLDIFRSEGAIYWLDKEHVTEPDAEGNTLFSGWDINYATFDFNKISSGNIANGKDACFVRCIEN